ncbi:MAG: ATP phosphoribosyltransferase regulatory subunit [Paracoccaceae bacterium]
MLRRPRSGPVQAALETALAKLSETFTDSGFATMDVPHLFLGDTLLDLYGEDLRARAFLFPDAERDNELCLRPDFTVPVALAHGAAGWTHTAAYSYSGPVFRRQPQGLGRPTEYMQAGVELFGETDTIAADARVFALLYRGLCALGMTGIETHIGDLSIPFALLDVLDMPDRRRAALRRHFWRPARFQTLIERACRPEPLSTTRARLLAGPATASFGEALGLRDAQEILDRLSDLADEAVDAPMPRADADLIGAVLALECPATEAPARLRQLVGHSGISPVIERLEARLDAFAAEGLDPAGMLFDANFGRNLEYYDGFVFEMRALGAVEHPPLAGGGRYDALTAKLGSATEIPAIGGIIRPESVLEVAQ